MQDGDLKDAASAQEANDAEKTDEQLWEEFTGDKGFQDDAGESEGDSDDDAENAEDTDGAEDDAGTDEGTDDDAGGDDDEGSSEGDDGDGSANDDAEDQDPEALRKQVERLQHSLSSEQGRTAKSQREIKRLQKELAEARKTPRDDDRDTSTNDDEIDERMRQAQEDYPDVIGPLADKIAAMDSRFDELSDREKKELDSKREEFNELTLEQQQLFEKEHPEGFDIIDKNRDVYNAWIEDQPKQLRDIHANNVDLITDGIGAAYLVSRFKQSLQDAAQGGDPPAEETNQQSRLEKRRQSQLDGARSTRSGGNRRAKTSDIPPNTDDDEEVFNYWVKKIEEKEQR